jgi:hypothetical protein
MRQALFKCEMPRLKLKSSRSFLAIKRCEGTKIGKIINRMAAIEAHERQVFEKLLWGLVSSTSFCPLLAFDS